MALEDKWKKATPANAVDMILASKKGRKPHQVRPHGFMVRALDEVHRDKVLDFGAGVGRNSYGLCKICKEVWAFDFPNMIKMLESNPKFEDSGIITSTDWSVVKNEKFSAIYAIIVLQHIQIDKVLLFLDDFATMTDNLYVQSRATSDDKSKLMYDLYKERWVLDKTFEKSKGAPEKAGGDKHYFIRLNPR